MWPLASSGPRRGCALCAHGLSPSIALTRILWLAEFPSEQPVSVVRDLGAIHAVNPWKMHVGPIRHARISLSVPSKANLKLNGFRSRVNILHTSLCHNTVHQWPGIKNKRIHQWACVKVLNAFSLKAHKSSTVH